MRKHINIFRKWRNIDNIFIKYIETALVRRYHVRKVPVDFFENVKYILYWTVVRELFNTAFGKWNIGYIGWSRGANPRLWLANWNIVDNIYICV